MESKATEGLTDSYDWYKQLKKAISKNRRDAHNRYLQLATVRPDGTPAVRTLVFRQLLQEPAQIFMVTDSRSDKPAQIATNPVAEICWYFTRTREQFRLHGSLSITGEDAPEQTMRSDIWSTMSESAKEQFYWPHPGQPLSNSMRVDELDSPPANFLVLTLLVERVDHLTLRGLPQTRWLSQRDDNGIWVSNAVNP